MGRKIANPLGFFVDRGNTWASSPGQSHSRHDSWKFSAKGAFNRKLPDPWRFSAKAPFIFGQSQCARFLRDSAPKAPFIFGQSPSRHVHGSLAPKAPFISSQSPSRHVHGSSAPKAPSIAMCQVPSRFSAKGAFNRNVPDPWRFSAKGAFNRNVPGPWRFSAKGAFHVSLGQRPRILVKEFTSAESAILICRSSRKLILSPR